MKKYTWRKFFGDVHLWLGIASGVVLFIVCLTGTILAFEHEIEEAFDADKHRAAYTQNTVPLPIDALIASTEKATGGKATAFRILEDKQKAYHIMIKKSEEGRPTLYFVDQYTGMVKGTSEGKASEAMGLVMELHRWLLVKGAGKVVVGISTIIFIVLLISGFVLWLPKRLKNLKQGLVVKTSAGWKRINHDLHNVLGFYALPLLLVMALTGLNWSFDWYRQGMSKVLNDEVFKQRNEKPMTSAPASPEAAPLQAAEYLQRAEAILPYSGDRYVILAAQPTDAVQVRKKGTGFFAVAAPDKVHLDRFTGEPLKIELYADLPLNEQVNALMRPLHTGEAFGMFSKILYFIACLVATTLPVTGTIIWINKLRKKAKKKSKQPTYNSRPVVG